MKNLKPSLMFEFAVDLMADGNLLARWTCPDAGQPAVCIKGSSRSIGEDGVDFHPADAKAAQELALAWGVPPPTMNAPRSYHPQDGMAFLLALYATYCRGSRFWAVPVTAGLLVSHPTMKLVVCDREGIELGLASRQTEPYVLISIRDPHSRAVRHRTSRLCRGVLELAFHDAEPSKHLAIPEGIMLMTPEHAQSLWRFMHAHVDHISTVIVHCEAGMSRSPAVAAALGEVLGIDTQKLLRYASPNQHVLKLLLKTFRQRAWLRNPEVQ